MTENQSLANLRSHNGSSSAWHTAFTRLRCVDGCAAHVNTDFESLSEGDGARGLSGDHAAAADAPAVSWGL